MVEGMGGGGHARRGEQGKDNQKPLLTRYIAKAAFLL